VGLTVIAFVDLEIIDNEYWITTDYKEEGTLRSRKNDAEIRLVAIDGTFRTMIFKKNALIRIVGNTLMFNSDDSDYLLVDHDKKFSIGKE
jgi:hypothetical protein